MVTFKGNPVTLEGREIREGDPAPDFTAIDKEMSPVKLSDLRGQVVIISAVPSIDTAVCATQTRRFNREAEKAGARTLTISMDLPFAQKRFCEAEGIQNLLMVSDYRNHEFAEKYGLMIRELGLISRAVFVIDKEGRVAYRQICEEIAEEPDYEAALEVARKIS